MAKVSTALRWLCDPVRLIAYQDESRVFRLTVLGQAGMRSMLPLSYIGAVGQLIRDLLSLDPNASFLGRWSASDHLFVVSLLSDRAPKLRRFSEALAEQIDGWVELRQAPDKPLLFAEWVMGAPSSSRADELLGSMGLDCPRTKEASRDGARKRAYLAMLAAILLDERSRGVATEDIERRWGVTGVDAIDEGWRDTALWLLAGHVALFDLRCFYHHAREICAADAAQVRATKQALGRMRAQAYDLLEQLKYCSPLGPMLRGVRASMRGVTGSVLGFGTVRKLESAGITSLLQVASMGTGDLESLGVQKRFAKQIVAYVRRRFR